jgi:hypothetical protein
VPDFGRRFSYIATGIYDEPTRLGWPVYLGIERANFNLNNVKVLTDDDPTNSNSVWTDITANQTTPQTAFNRSQGTYLIQDVYSMVAQSGRRVAFQLVGQTKDQYDKLYSVFLAYRQQK